jgi:hypothetical protein
MLDRYLFTLNSNPMKNHLAFTKLSTMYVMLALISLFTLATSSSYSQVSGDFSGTWKLNLSKSNPIPPLLSSTLVITQKGNEFAVSTTNTIKDQKPLTHSEKYVIDVDLAIKGGDKTRTIKCRWCADKNTFSITETYIFDMDSTRKESKRISVYSLIDQGKTLKIVIDDSVPPIPSIPDGKMHTVSIYNK